MRSKNKDVVENVILVNMPLAATNYPSLALGILQTLVQERGHSCTTHNFNLFYAQLLGEHNYKDLSEGLVDQLGEQIFGHLLFPERLANPEFSKYVLKGTDIKTFLATVEVAREFISVCVDVLMSSNPTVVACTTTFFQKMASLALFAELKKQAPNILTVFGGADCESPMGESLLKMFPSVDVIFHGDAENSFPEFVDQCNKRAIWKDLNGFSYRDLTTGRITNLPRAIVSDMNQVPIPNYDDYTSDRRLYQMLELENWQLSYEISRGCWWGQKNHCTFCGLNGRQMNYRKKESHIVFNQLTHLRERYGERQVNLTDNISSIKFCEEFAPILGSITGFRYFLEVKANLKREELTTLRRNNITTIQPGIERLNSGVLKQMRKGVRAFNNILLLRNCSELGVNVLWNYLIGFPNEDPEGVEQELKILPKIKHLQPPVGTGQVRVDRFSPFFNSPEANGLLIEDVSVSEYWLFNESPDRINAAYSFESRSINFTNENLANLCVNIDKVVSEWIHDYTQNMFTCFRYKNEIVVHDFRTDVCSETILSGSALHAFEISQHGCASHKAKINSTLLKDFSNLSELGILLCLDDVFISLPVMIDKNVS